MFSYARDLPFSEKMFWAAVLRRAVFDYVLYKGVRRHALAWKHAAQYIFEPGLRYENGLSFEEVCELFDWNAGYLRRMTTQLTRADIKKMETTQLREEFVYDAAASVVRQTERWKTENFATPFLPLYRYNEEYREKFRPKVVERETLLGSIPMVQWQAAAV